MGKGFFELSFFLLPDGPFASPLFDNPRSVWASQKGQHIKKKAGFDDVT
jgi:hypothetical protein